MSSLPIFIAAVANSADDPLYPVLFTWSNHDGEIKEVLVIPDDEWLEQAPIEPNAQHISEQQLYEFGHEAQDILTEWLSELDTDVVYALEPEQVSPLVEAIFAVKHQDPSFEVRSVSEWYQLQGENFHAIIEGEELSTPLHLMSPDEQVLLILQLAADNNLLPDFT